MTDHTSLGHAIVPPAGRVVSIAVSLITIAVIANFIRGFEQSDR
jgi:hypothetical protein